MVCSGDLLLRIFFNSIYCLTEFGSFPRMAMAFLLTMAVDLSMARWDIRTSASSPIFVKAFGESAPWKDRWMVLAQCWKKPFLPLPPDLCEYLYDAPSLPL